MFMHVPTDPCKEPMHQLKNTKFQQRASIDLDMEASHSFTVFCKSIINNLMAGGVLETVSFSQ